MGETCDTIHFIMSHVMTAELSQTSKNIKGKIASLLASKLDMLCMQVLYLNGSVRLFFYYISLSYTD